MRTISTNYFSFVKFLDIYFNLCQSFETLEVIKKAQLWVESRVVKNGDFANPDSIHWHEKSYGNTSDFSELQYLKFTWTCPGIDVDKWIICTGFLHKWCDLFFFFFNLSIIWFQKYWMTFNLWNNTLER